MAGEGPRSGLRWERRDDPEANGNLFLRKVRVSAEGWPSTSTTTLATASGATPMSRVAVTRSGPVAQRLDRAHRDPQQPGHLLLGQVLVVAEHQHGPLAGREPADGRPDDHELLVGAEVDRLGPLPAGVAGLQAQPAQQRPVPVHEHLAGVGLRVLLPAHQRPPPVDADQGLLGQLLALGPAPGQQEAQAAQPPVLADEEVGELPVLGAHALSRAGSGVPETPSNPERFQ